MNNFTTKTIREIALEYPETTRVFEDLKIDYCCGGRKSLDDACTASGLDSASVAERIETAIRDHAPANGAATPEKGSPTDLIAYIISKHHVFTVQEIERLTPLMEKVCIRHGEQHPKLYELQKIFLDLVDSLIPHMRKEESVLFPYIESIESASLNGSAFIRPHFGTVENPIRMMMFEHDTDGERLRIMREIAKDYQLPADACPSFTALYAGLQDLEKDLHRHIHLENNVLFPAAIGLERTSAAAA